jgi:hypothetical protein
MKLLKLVLFLIGLILLGINIYGLFQSLRNNDLYTETTPYKKDISIHFDEARRLWHRGKNESEKNFALRSSKLINRTMAHYWKDEGIRKYNMLIPLWENYILRIRQWISGDKKYEFRNYKKAMERGVGICSQPCIALQYLLKHNRIKADLWDLKGHVVVEVTFSDGTKYLLDPDYGQYVPYGMDQIQENPELVREYYINQNNIYADHVKDHKTTDDIVRLYEKGGNHIYYMKKSFEDISYMLIWIIPLLLMSPYAYKIYKKAGR